ncbi:hypothetical protein [Nonomuraea rhodomycinica]|uniref:Uncharacterized protein n=1 Tax=Nonomuraea rhodomycinica TaxID=1712872 RepID=A0A7Y6MBE9_9ACTN|nr:hypothetical protein [Nonomuraea rhodomycinica]NUW40835.1 hypothetical protein [Nonomuraea rhodomycinica]
MRRHTHDLAPVPQPQQPQRLPLRGGAELRRPPSEHRVRTRQQTQAARIVPRRRSY